MSDFSGSPTIQEKRKQKTKEPERYAVILHNDHYTTMEFVVEILKGIFHKSAVEATKIMLDVHRKGRGRVGSYSYDIANTKVQQVQKKARAAGFPLKCSIQKD